MLDLLHVHKSFANWHKQNIPRYQIQYARSTKYEQYTFANVIAFKTAFNYEMLFNTSQNIALSEKCDYLQLAAVTVLHVISNTLLV